MRGPEGCRRSPFRRKQGNANDFMYMYIFYFTKVLWLSQGERTFAKYYIYIYIYIYITFAKYYIYVYITFARISLTLPTTVLENADDLVLGAF